MEVVEEFKEELHGLYDSKLPVSRAKMGAITKLAMKSIKHYKHVVMIVEKFITKSAAPYKLPALYVIDSIIRQSKHQYQGPKEVYGPRFGSKLDKLFPHILECLESDRPKVAKVLNLWLKNGVYPSEVLSPLFDQVGIVASTSEQTSSVTEEPTVDDKREVMMEISSSPQQGQIDTLLKNQQEQLQNLLQNSKNTEQNEMIDTLLGKAKQLQELQSIHQQIVSNEPLTDTVKSNGEGHTDGRTTRKNRSSMVANEFSKALLDNFDYSSDEDNDNPLSARLGSSPSHDNKSHDTNDASAIIDQLEEQFKQEMSNEVHTQATPHAPPPVMRPMDASHMHLPPNERWPRPPLINPRYPSYDNSWRGEERWESSRHAPPHFDQPMYDRYHCRDTPPPYPERERRSERHYRRSSRDLDRHDDRRRYRHDDRHYDDWRRGRDRPPICDKTTRIKPGHVTVYSTTIWLGHLSKTVSREELSQKVEQLGPVKSVDYIVARGCAYIVMETREASEKVMDKLKDMLDIKCKIAWAPGRGVKGKVYHTYWEVNSGLSHIPCDLIKSSTELDSLSVGGYIDPSTVPPHLSN